MDLISVIVPIYNVEQYLDCCVESLISQTYPHLEIILVDDGSPDACPSMCDEWASIDNRIRVVHKQNGGLSDARNAGMAIATGDYIGFVDSDDWVAPEMYGKLLNSMIVSDSDIAACSVEMVWDDASENIMLTESVNCVLSNDEAQSALLSETLLKQPVWYKLYKREVIAGLQFEKGKYHEDVFWSYLVLANAHRVSLIEYKGYFYRQRSESIMGKSYSLKRLDGIEAACRRYCFFKTNYPQLVSQASRSLWGDIIYSGQMSLKFLSPQEQEKAFSYLQEVLRRYPLNEGALSDEKISHKIWMRLAGYSLKSTCRLKNMLNVGF